MTIESNHLRNLAKAIDECDAVDSYVGEHREAVCKDRDATIQWQRHREDSRHAIVVKVVSEVIRHHLPDLMMEAVSRCEGAVKAARKDLESSKAKATFGVEVMKKEKADDKTDNPKSIDPKASKAK